MRILSLFSGIGAFERALDNIGIDWELVNYCDIDKFASKSYSILHSVSEEMNLGDISKVDMEQFKKGCANLVTFGFPCQDISCAGSRKGFCDEDGEYTRSGMFFYATEVINKVQPEFAIFENVKNLVGKEMQWEFDTVLGAMDKLGYSVYVTVLRGDDYGIPQGRERVIGVCIRKDIDRGYLFPQKQQLKQYLIDLEDVTVNKKYYLTNKQVEKIKLSTYNKDRARIQEKDVCMTLLASETPKCVKRIRQIGCMSNDSRENPSCGRVYYSGGLAPTLDTAGGGARQPIVYASRGRNVNNPSSRRAGEECKQVFEANNNGCVNALTTVLKDNYVSDNGSDYRRLTPREYFKLMGFRGEDADLLLTKGMSDTQLYKQAGNSIIVPVLEGVFRELANFYPGIFIYKKCLLGV